MQSPSAPPPTRIRTPSERFVIARRRDRLGARLLALLGSWRLARKLDAHLVMYWADLDQAGPPLALDEHRMGALFDLEALALQGLHREITIIEGYRPPPKGAIAIEADPQMAEARRRGLTPEEAFARGPVLETYGDGVLRLAGENRDDARAEIGPLYERLLLREPIARAVRRFEADVAGAPHVVMHVRRGDILDGLIGAIRRLGEPDGSDGELQKFARYYAQRCTPIDALLRRLDQAAGPRARIIVTGDSPVFVQAARERIAPERLAAVDLDALAEGLTAPQRALFEIEVLRRARRIVGGPSAFSRVAALIGPAQLALEIGSVEERVAAFRTEALEPAGVGAQERWLDFFKTACEPDGRHG